MTEPERKGPLRRMGGGDNRPPFRILASTIALPLIAFFLFAIYQWVLGGGAPTPSQAPPEASSAPVDSRPAALVPPPAPAPAAEEKRPAPESAVTGRIVLILDDVGYDPAAAKRAAALPATISFAVIPGTPHARSSAEFLAARGFEILCHLPMEPVGYPEVSPGDGAILMSLADDEIRRRTTALFRQVPHAIGVNNHMGSAATADRRVMENVLHSIRAEGVFFVDSRTSGRSVAERTARQLGIPTVGRDVFLDDDPSEAAIRRQLRELSDVAARSGRITVAIGHLYPSTLRVLSEELPRMKAAGYQFLPASAAVARPSAAPDTVAAR